MKCSYCGLEIAEDAHFCPYCGDKTTKPSYEEKINNKSQVSPPLNLHEIVSYM